MKSIVILISSRGSNMLALLEAGLPCQIAAVISNRADAPGLEIARQHGVATQVVAHCDHADRAAFDRALAECIDRYQPDLVVLAGFMRILSAQFVAHYKGKLINIHPSLLPAYAGLDTHARVLQDGVKIHGCTVHFVTDNLDHGPIILQVAVPVLMNDTAATLSARVLYQEHRIYQQVVRLICEGHISLSDEGKARVARCEQPGCALISPGVSLDSGHHS